MWAPGDEVYALVSAGQNNQTLVGYTARLRKKDGALVWCRNGGPAGGGVVSVRGRSRAAFAFARQFADRRGLIWAGTNGLHNILCEKLKVELTLKQHMARAIRRAETTGAIPMLLAEINAECQH